MRKLQLDGYCMGILYWLAENTDGAGVVTTTLDILVDTLKFPKKVIRNRLQFLTIGHVIGHEKGTKNLVITLYNKKDKDTSKKTLGTKRARQRARTIDVNQVEIPLPTILQSIVDEVGCDTPPPKKAAGAYAFECYARHYEAKYNCKPLRDRMANIHAKSIAESVPAADIDAFFASYLSNPAAYYVMKAHPLSLARIDVQKIYTELSTGMRLTSHLSRQYETATENQEAAKRYMEKKYGSGFSAKP